jgi:hypothetical protein
MCEHTGARTWPQLVILLNCFTIITICNNMYNQYTWCILFLQLTTDIVVIDVVIAMTYSSNFPLPGLMHQRGRVRVHYGIDYSRSWPISGNAGIPIFDSCGDYNRRNDVDNNWVVSAIRHRLWWRRQIFAACHGKASTAVSRILWWRAMADTQNVCEWFADVLQFAAPSGRADDRRRLYYSGSTELR